MKLNMSAATAVLIASLAALADGPSGAQAQTPSMQNSAGPTFTVLGSNSGPGPNPTRAQPANLVQYGSQKILVDVGDGASGQLGKAGVGLGQIDTVIISHLHFDHTGGLFAFLGQRYQLLQDQPLSIYGPRGTRALVASLVAGIDASIEGPNDMRAFAPGDPDASITVVELDDGATFDVDGIHVIAVKNSHFSATRNGDDPHFASLSFRFETPERSIVYTGDTGPSPAVEALAKNVDLLISEIMDPDILMQQTRAALPSAPQAQLDRIDAHFRRQHLSPENVGLMASRSGARSLVLTHIALPDSAIASARQEISNHFAGPTDFAADLDEF